MLKRLLLLAALLLAHFVPAAAAPGLWVAKDGKAEVTIFGTIHALPRGNGWLSPAFARRFDRADRLVLETIIPDDPMALAPVVSRLGMRAGLPPIRQRVSPAAYARLAPILATTGLPVAALDNMESWLAAITVSEASLAAVGIDPKQGVEPALLARARRLNKPVTGLETPTEQLGFLDGLPEADQAAMLEAVLADTADVRAETQRLIGLWQDAEVETIAADFSNEAKATPTLQRVLLSERNRRWADEVVAMLRRPGRVFLAVGAAHLGGRDGLLTILANRGLTVEAVDMAAERAAAPPARKAKAGKPVKGKKGEKAEKGKKGKKAKAEKPAKGKKAKATPKAKAKAKKKK